MFRSWLMNRVAWAPSDAGGGAPAAAAPAAAAPAAAAPAAAAAPPVAPAPVAFAEQLPESIRGEAVFRDIKDLAGLANGYLHAQKMIGQDPKNVLVLPAPDDADAWNAAFAKLGRPEKADGYQVTAPEGVAVDAALQTAFLEKAHAAGLSQRQAESLYGWYNEMGAASTAARTAASAASLEAATTQLRTEWGAAFDQNLDLANKAIAHYGGAQLDAELKANGLANSPHLAKVLAKMGRQLSEDGVVGRIAPGGTLVKSPGEAKQEINALYADKAFTAVYANKTALGHADAVARMQALFQLAHPEG